MRLALDWQASSDGEDSAPKKRSLRRSQFVIVSSLSLFWERGHRSEVVETLKRLLQLDQGNEPTSERARALDVGGFLLWSLNRLPEARVFLNESVAIAERLKDDSLLIWPLMYLGWTFWGLHEYDHARDYLERSLSISRRLGEQGAVGVAMAYLGDIPYAQGNLPEARKRYEEAIELLRELQNPSMMAPTLRRLGYVQLHEGKFDRAASLFSESLDLNLQLDHRHGTVASLAGFAAIHLAKQRFEQAAVLYGFVEDQIRQSGNPLLFTDTVEFQRSIAQLRQKLDARTLSAAWSRGSSLTREEAMELARQARI